VDGLCHYWQLAGDLKLGGGSGWAISFEESHVC
jgi:hypothetical protein